MTLEQQQIRDAYKALRPHVLCGGLALLDALETAHLIENSGATFYRGLVDGTTDDLVANRIKSYGKTVEL